MSGKSQIKIPQAQVNFKDNIFVLIIVCLGSHTARVLLLGVMLSVNNIGLGIAAGVAGMQPGMLVCFTLIFTLLACYIGVLCAKKLRRYLSGRSLTLLSNLILLAIGLYELLNGLIARGF